MQGLPLCNPQLSVEGVGFAAMGEHQLGVLITPWFMNLVLLPGTDDWRDYEQGSTSEYGLPAGPYEFTTCHDDTLGHYLTAVLFRTVQDIPDQSAARDIAVEILSELRTAPSAVKSAQPVRQRPELTRRALFGVAGST